MCFLLAFLIHRVLEAFSLGFCFSFFFRLFLLPLPSSVSPPCGLPCLFLLLLLPSSVPSFSFAFPFTLVLSMTPHGSRTAHICICMYVCMFSLCSLGLPCQIQAPTRSCLTQTGTSGAWIWPGTVRQGLFVCGWVHDAPCGPDGSIQCYNT